MQKVYIYTKLLYLDNKELILLGNFLKIHGYYGGLQNKKKLEKMGLQSYLTYLITSNRTKSFEELKLFIFSLKNIQILQILGIIKNNILISNETLSLKISSKNNSVINLIKKLLICSLLLLSITFKILIFFEKVEIKKKK